MSGTECSRLASALPLPSLTNQQQGGAWGWEGARFKEALTVSIAQVPILYGHGPEKESPLKFGMRVSFFTLLLALASRAWFTHSGRGCPEPPEESWGSVPGNVRSTLLTLTPHPQPQVRVRSPWRGSVPRKGQLVPNFPRLGEATWSPPFGASAELEVPGFYPALSTAFSPPTFTSKGQVHTQLGEGSQTSSPLNSRS